MQNIELRKVIRAWVLLLSTLLIGCTPVRIRTVSLSSYDGLAKGAKVKGYLAVYEYSACPFSKVILIPHGQGEKSYSADTNDEGYFAFPIIPAGRYTVTTEGCDFPNKQRNQIEVYDGCTTVISIIGHMIHDLSVT